MRALALAPGRDRRAVTDSGLRGRGGAAFPTGIKWKTVLDTRRATQKYVVCNADEGDSGTFADRMIMEGDPFVLIEGMTIAGLAVGATQGYIYLRSRVSRTPCACSSAAIARRAAAGFLGSDVLGSGKRVRRSRCACGAGCLHLRRGDRAAREPRGQARHGALQAAAAGDRGAVRPADGRSTT